MHSAPFYSVLDRLIPIDNKNGQQGYAWWLSKIYYTDQVHGVILGTRWIERLSLWYHGGGYVRIPVTHHDFSKVILYSLCKIMVNHSDINHDIKHTLYNPFVDNMEHLPS